MLAGIPRPHSQIGHDFGFLLGVLAYEGQFAKKYKRLSAELPSETLKKRYGHLYRDAL